ncbi:LysR family transcriptional regulator [Shewanella psychropiezotolerans]|uniref:LysR family transcriptional regulator n=1 Tax=Shewanella psychropiezotolerans TaxID=2593655 RepID=A0ABX5WW27_9GAMM|nr:LysR family transcriptional regulator [Shewanella psychropiezotolerans]QDO82372.1 LysR family transcriptional regulator [Shewanella psychropiezotolerans]
MKSHSLDDLQLFILAAKYKSLTQASEHLSVPLATLSRRLKRLEVKLNCRLFNRSAHHFSLTLDGEKYRQLCEPLILGLENVTDRIAQDRKALSGKIKISAPINMTQVWLKHCIYEFAEKHPDICIDLDVQNDKIDLISKQVDITFRIGDLIEMDWVARKLWHLPFGLCASTFYLEQYAPITHPSELARHRLITVNNDRHWKMTHQISGEIFSYEDTFNFSSNDVLLVRDAAVKGLGIAWIPPYYFNNLAKNNHHLEPVLPDWQGAEREVYIMYRDRDKRPARIDAFINHVYEWKSRFNMGL